MSVVGVVPPNFSWVIDNFLAALAFPSQPGHIQYLLDHNIKYLISLTDKRSPNVTGFPDLHMIRIPVVDYTPPTLDQINKAISIIDEAKAEGRGVALHCAKGYGRTGTIIASYLVREQCYLTKDAIKETRRIRPQSIETVEQEKAVGAYEEYLNSSPNGRVCFKD